MTAPTPTLEERLREYNPPDRTWCNCGADTELGPHDPSCDVPKSALMYEAADELARLRAENEALRDALQRGLIYMTTYRSSESFHIHV